MTTDMKNQMKTKAISAKSAQTSKADSISDGLAELKAERKKVAAEIKKGATPAELNQLSGEDISLANADIQREKILSLNLSDVAEFCENSLSASRLDIDLHSDDELAGDELLGGAITPVPFNSRSSFCEYLGIRESTLSGWIKDDRIPRMAKEAYILLKIFSELKDYILELKKERDSNGLKLIKDGDKYHLIRLQKDASVCGEVIAKDISSEQEAELLVHSEDALNLAESFHPYPPSSYSPLALLHETARGKVEDGDDAYASWARSLDKWDLLNRKTENIRKEINSPDEFQKNKKRRNELARNIVKKSKGDRAMIKGVYSLIKEENSKQGEDK